MEGVGDRILLVLVGIHSILFCRDEDVGIWNHVDEEIGHVQCHESTRILAESSVSDGIYSVRARIPLCIYS